MKTYLMRREVLSIRAARPCQSVSSHSNAPLQEKEGEENSPEPPARVARLATPRAAINLTVKTLDAIVVAKIEARVGVLVLHLDLDLGVVGVAGRRAHALCLAGVVISSEHAAVAPTGVVDPALDLVGAHAPAPGEAFGRCDFCVDGGDDGQGDGGGNLHGGRCVLGLVCEVREERRWLVLVVGV